MLQTPGCGEHSATSICANASGISAPNLVIRSRFCLHGPSCTSLVLCARLTRLSDSVSALGAEVLVTCSVTTWKALQPSTILKWPLLFPAAAWYNQQVTLHDVTIFFPPWHSIASSTWKESHQDALVVMTTIIFVQENIVFTLLGVNWVLVTRAPKETGETGSSKRRRGKLGRAWKRGYKLVVTATDTICKQVNRGRRFSRVIKHFPYLYCTFAVWKAAIEFPVQYFIYFCYFVVELW